MKMDKLRYKKRILRSDNRNILQKLLLSNSKLAHDIYKVLVDGDAGNIIFSPISLQISLLMLFSGASGETEYQLKSRLNLTEGKEEVLEGTKILLECLQNSCLKIASQMFIAKQYPIKKSYEQLVEKYFEPIYQTVDFNKSSAAAVNLINEWISKKTNNSITNIISSNELNQYTVMILLNAVYFKAEWCSKFGTVFTKNEPFHLSRNRSVQIPMMSKSEFMCHSKQESFGILEIPYRAEGVRFLVFLPDEIDGLPELESALFDNELHGMINKLKCIWVNLQLPRMKIEELINVKDVMEKLGVNQMFDPVRADFFDMFSGEMLDQLDDVFHVDNIVHEAVLTVNEEGTEASAFTRAILRGGGPPPPSIDFHVNRPFVFMILQGDFILFMGRVTNPPE